MTGGYEGSMRWFEQFKRVALADTDGELGRADLVALATRGILALGRKGTRGDLEFPPGIILRVSAKEGSLETLRGWVADPATEREITARLLNERIALSALPARRWEVERGDADGVEVLDDPAPILGVLVVDGGDRDGDRYPIGPARRDWHVGRGRWHADNRVLNDIVLAEVAPWLSRAAAVFRRGPSGFEIESRDQGEFVIVVPQTGTPRRPAMTASGRVPLTVGDRVDFHDGKDARISLRLEAP